MLLYCCNSKFTALVLVGLGLRLGVFFCIRFCVFLLGFCEFSCLYRFSWLHGKTRLQNDILYVKLDVKLYSSSHLNGCICCARCAVFGVSFYSMSQPLFRNRVRCTPSVIVYCWCEGGLLVHIWASSVSRSVAANVAARRFLAESPHSQCS